MMGLIQLCAFVLLPAMCMAAVDLKPYNVTAHHMFIEADQDNDGEISMAEVSDIFLAYDSDRNGRVSRHEYTSYVDLHTPELHALSHALYDIYDVDHDHHLDQHDFDNFFSLMDANQDQIVQEEEFVNYWAGLFYALEHLHGHGTGR